MEKNSKIYVAGHRGMVGGAIVRDLQRQGYTNIDGIHLAYQDFLNNSMRAER